MTIWKIGVVFILKTTLCRLRVLSDEGLISDLDGSLQLYMCFSVICQ